MSSIKLAGLTKRFGHSTAVNAIDLAIAEGELIALLGPSGCGKTTTLRMLAGFVSPDAGEISVDGIVVSSPRQTMPPEKRNMSMIFQSYAIWPHKTVFENVAFGLQLRQIGKAELRSRVMQALEITHLNELADRYPAQLSGGQQQRVALARAIVIEPQILLLDEPLSNLDASLRDEMRNEIRRVHDATGLTTIYVTHDQSEALVLADRIVVMSAGNIEQVGTPEDIYERPATEFVANFIGRCNVLSGQLLEDDRVDVQGITLQAQDRADNLVPGQPVAVSIRPHSIKMDSLKGIVDPSNNNYFRVQIEQQSYFGEFREYQVRLENSAVKLSVITSPQTHYQNGDRQIIQISPAHCRIVPRQLQPT